MAADVKMLPSRLLSSLSLHFHALLPELVSCGFQCHTQKNNWRCCRTSLIWQSRQWIRLCSNVRCLMIRSQGSGTKTEWRSCQANASKWLTLEGTRIHDWIQTHFSDILSWLRIEILSSNHKVEVSPASHLLLFQVSSAVYWRCEARGRWRLYICSWWIRPVTFCQAQLLGWERQNNYRGSIMTALIISQLPNIFNSLFLSKQKLRSTTCLDKVGSLKCPQFINN